MGDTTVGDTSGSDLRLLDDVSRLVEQAKVLQDSAASLISRTSRDEDSLRQSANSLNSALLALLSSVKKSNLDSKRAEKLEEELFRARYILSEGDAAAFLPSKSHGFAIAFFLVSFAPDILCVLRSAFEDVQFLLLIGPVNLDFLAGRFLRMFLGPINVRANRKDVQLKVKEEYNSFRDRTAYLFLLFPLLLIISRSWIWNGCLPALPVQLYQAWLLYLYTGLALRENILRVNGSDIRPWWIYHHYFAMAMALISLTWEIEREPDCAQKQKGVLLFLKWAIMQGIAMLLQNRYQRQRLYTRIALGKAGRMDVVWGETAGVEGQLWLLCPILFILQGFEAYVGLLLLKTALVGVTSEWQVVTCGILLIIMAVGNFANTVQTLVSKSRVKAKMKRGKSRQELDQGAVKNQ